MKGWNINVLRKIKHMFVANQLNIDVLVCNLYSRCGEDDKKWNFHQELKQTACNYGGQYLRPALTIELKIAVISA